MRHGILSAVKNISNDIFELTITFEDKFSFMAGEYVWIVLDELKGSNELDRRAFSISSVDGAVKEITLIFRSSNSFFKKTILSKQIGSKLKVYGPHGGSFDVIKGKSNKYVLLAGGVGIAPFLSIIRSANKKQANNFAITLIYNKRPTDKIYPEELASIDSEHNNISVETHDGLLENSHIAQHIHKDTKYLICGSSEYVAEAYRLLIQNGISRDNMHFEENYPVNPQRNEILELAKYIIDVANNGEDSVIERKTSLYNFIRIRYFIYLLVLSIFGTIALLYFAKVFGNQSLAEPENLVWWSFLTIQVANLLYYYLFRLYTSSVLISINALGLAMIIFTLTDPRGSLEKAWFMLPVAMLFFFVNRKIALINSIIYTVAVISIFTVTLYLGLPLGWWNSEPIFLLITFLLSSAALLLFSAVSLLISKSENILVNHLSAFSTLVKAVNDSSSHMIITDDNGVILYGNKAAAENTGFTTSNMIGQTPRLWGGLATLEYYKKLWTKKRIQVIKNEELVNRNKHGDPYNVNAHISKITGKDNKIIGYIASEENITKLKSTEQFLSNAKDRIDNIINGTELGTWEWNVQTGETIFNERWANIIGYTLEEIAPISIKTWEKFAHPDDLKGSEAELNKHFAGETKFYNFKSRMKHKNGQWVWVLDRGKVSSWTPDGKPEWMFGSHLDITAEQEIDQAKSEFVSLASHQLRTPLSSINWYTEMLLDGDAGKLTKKQQEYIKTVDKANSRMVDLINSLLNVSRLELGTFSIDTEKLNLKTSAQEIIAEIETKVSERKQKLAVSFDDTLPEIIFDRKYLEMIYQNLLSNAVKYSPENSTITLDVKHVSPGNLIQGYKIPKKGIVITVSDMGYGIPSSQQAQIFTKLFRADNAQVYDTDGTGLGLYIIKSIIDHVGGNLWFKSKENKGSSFYAFLPLESESKTGTKKLG